MTTIRGTLPNPFFAHPMFRSLLPAQRLHRSVSVLTPHIRPAPVRHLSWSHVQLAKGGKQKSAKQQASAAVEEEDDPIPTPKGKHGKVPISTDSLIPASQSKIAPEAQVEAEKVEKKMKASVDWFRKESVALENRALGRVTPAILDPVKVHLDEDKGGEVKLRDVATIGVKEGTILVVTLFDEHNMKAVEKGIYAAHIPQCVPQKVDSRTIRIPMPKPTLDARAAFLKSGSKLAEDTKVKVRSSRESGVKWLSKEKYGKHTPEMANMQTLTDKYIGEVDKVVQKLKVALEI